MLLSNKKNRIRLCFILVFCVINLYSSFFCFGSYMINCTYSCNLSNKKGKIKMSENTIMIKKGLTLLKILLLIYFYFSINYSSSDSSHTVSLGYLLSNWARKVDTCISLLYYGYYPQWFLKFQTLHESGGT